MYNLGTRYYDPEIGRFINADSYVSTGQGTVGHNMFAYCGNNPINRIDPNGEAWADTIKNFINKISLMLAAISNNAVVHTSTEMDVCTDGNVNTNSKQPYGDLDHYGDIALQIDGIYSDMTNYMVIPINCDGYEKLLGCVGVIYNNITGEYVYAIVGDGGPAEGGGGYGKSPWDEVSIHAAWCLNGYKTGTPIANRRQYGSYTFVIFPNSKEKWKDDNLQNQINSIAANYWRPII